MRTGIIGLPQVGKTSLFQILTGQHAAHGSPRQTHVGIAKVPDSRLDRLAELYKPRKLVHAAVEFVDVAAIGKEALKETAYATTLRTTDALAHVVRTFEDPTVPHVGPIDPRRDIGNVEVDLILSDLGQIEKRLERLEKDIKKMKSDELVREFELLRRAQGHLEGERPLREMNMTNEEKKRIRGFMFLSEKPMLYVLNVNESASLETELETAAERFGVASLEERPNTAVTAVCGKVEAELAEMAPDDQPEFLASYGLKESGLVRLIRKTYELMGLISFFTLGEDECRAWTIESGTRAVNAAGTIHSDLEKHFIRAEVIHWDQLLQAGSEANARAQGTLRLEGKDYVLRDGDVMHVRHSA
jgi:GTP-binding protein YchF